MTSFDEMAHADREYQDASGGWTAPQDDRTADDMMPPFPPVEAYEAEAYSTAGSQTPDASSFRFVPVGDLEYRDPEFLIGNLIETDALGLIFGDPGCGKSFLAVDLGLCVATGTAFHGRSVMQGPVFLIAGEGHNGLARRFHAWSLEQSCTLSDVPLFKSERAAQFLDGASAKAVSDAVTALADDHGRPRLIIVDTVARNFGAGDENSTQDMSNFIVAMDDLKSRYPGCVLLLVHHSGHADKGRARGAMALKGALDFEFRVEKDGTSIQVINTKMKDAEPPADLHFTLESVQLRGGAQSAVLRAGDAPERKARRTTAQRLALTTYKDAARLHGVWDDEGKVFRGVHIEHWRDSFYAKHTGDNAETKRKAFQRARSDLTGSGDMTVQDDIYLVADREVQTAVFMAGKPQVGQPGHSGTI